MDPSAPPPADELAPVAERARAAYLETIADAERRRAAEAEHRIARADELIDETLQLDRSDFVLVPFTVAGRPSVMVHVAGVRLYIDAAFPGAARGLIACPMCAAPNCRTVELIDNLAQLGRLIDAPATFELLGHEGVGGGMCNGWVEREPRQPLRAWRAVIASDPEAIEQVMNALDRDGYDPSVVYDSHGSSLVIGRAARVFADDNDPF